VYFCKVKFLRTHCQLLGGAFEEIHTLRVAVAGCAVRNVFRIVPLLGLNLDKVELATY
jgi:hypothetical protein